MHYEVELKFPVGELSAIEARLGALGITPAAPVAEVDVYFSHPCRDFAQTDEALRLRSRAGMAYLAYKGPKLDQTTKTRREIDLPLGDAARLTNWRALLEAMGFTPLAEVRKTRRKARRAWQGREVEISLDEVVGLGSFVELETLCDVGQLPQAKQCLESLAAALGLSGGERRSYLELLLGRQAAVQPC
jgi:adenylate cyclase class 2